MNESCTDQAHATRDIGATANESLTPSRVNFMGRGDATINAAYTLDEKTMCLKSSGSYYYSMYGFTGLDVTIAFANGSTHVCNTTNVSKSIIIENNLICKGKRECEYYMAVTFSTMVTECEASAICNGFYTSEIEGHSESSSALISYIMCNQVIYGMVCRRMSNIDDIFGAIHKRIDNPISVMRNKIIQLPATHWVQAYYNQTIELYDSGLKNKIRREPAAVLSYIEFFEKYMLTRGLT
jgi:hypothetical protein